MAKLERGVIDVKQRTPGANNGTTRVTYIARGHSSDLGLAMLVARYLQATVTAAEIRAIARLFAGDVILH